MPTSGVDLYQLSSLDRMTGLNKELYIFILKLHILDDSCVCRCICMSKMFSLIFIDSEETRCGTTRQRGTKTWR